MMKHCNLSLKTTGLSLVTVLLLASSVAQAKDKPESGQHFDNWKTLGSGYVARRKVPPRMEMPVEQATTQELRSPGTGNTDNRMSVESKMAPKSVTKRNRGRNKSALWLHTGAAGLYGVSIADLAVELGTKEKTLRRQAASGGISLTNAGAPVSWYFDAASDTFLFAGEAYDNFYTDKNAYYLTLDYKKAHPMAVVYGAPTVSPGTGSPFSETLKFEEEPYMYYATWSVAAEPDADYWWWDYLLGGSRDSIDVPLNIPDPASTSTAQMRITLRGWTDLEEGDEHTVRAELNGIPIGLPITWDAFGEKVLKADFDQATPGILDPAGNNTLSLFNSYAPGTTPGQWLDTVEIDYSRLPTAVEDKGMLWLHDVAAGTQQVTGFAGGNIMVIESPAGSAVMREDIRIEADGPDGWMVTFDTTAGADYLVVEAGALEAPSLALATPSRLNYKNNRAEYLVIAPREFEGTASTLAAYRSERFKHVKIVWLDEIYSEFSYGRVDPFALQQFMKRVKKWKTKPSYVVIIGKGTLDEKKRFNYDSFVPVVMTSSPWALAASDERLLAGEKDAKFAIGRLPITNDAEGMAYLDKLIDFESTKPRSERYEAVLVADNPDDAGEFQDNSDLLADRLLDTLGFDLVTSLYHPGAPDTSVRDDLTKTSTWENGYVSYDGHGSTAQLGDYREEFIMASDAENLMNVAYPIFTALTCAAGDDTLPGVRSLASALVLNPVGGAIAAFAPTGLSLDAEAQLMGNAFVDSLFGKDETIGNAVHDAKSETIDTVPAFMRRMYSVVGEPSLYAR